MTELLQRERGRGDTVRDRLVDDVRAQIERGALAPGARLMSEGQLSVTYGIGRSSVREALKELTRLGLVHTLPGKGSYVRRRAAGSESRSLRLVFQHTLDITNPYVSTLLRGVQDACQERGYNLQLFARQGEAQSRVHGRTIGDDILGDRSFAGILLVGLTTLEDLVALAHDGRPFVLVNSDVPGVDLYSVAPDHIEIGFQVARHLAACGRRRLGLITGPAPRVSAELIRRGFALGCRTAGLFESPVAAATGEYTEEAGYGLMREWLEQRVAIDGLFVQDEAMAKGAQRALLESGRRIPADIAMVGYGHKMPPDWFPVPLTTINNHLAEMGRLGASLLIDLAEGRPPATFKHYMRATLEIRASCGAASGHG
jgi:LacI family transcriptional regulator